VRSGAPADLLEREPLEHVEGEKVPRAWLEPAERLHQRGPEHGVLGATEERGLRVEVRRRELGHAPELLLGPTSRLEEVQGNAQQDGAEPGVEAAPPLVLGELGSSRAQEQTLTGPLEDLSPQLVVGAQAAQRPRQHGPEPHVQLLQRELLPFERGAGQVEVPRVERNPVVAQRRAPVGEEAKERSGFELEVRVRVLRDGERATELDHVGSALARVSHPGTRSPLACSLPDPPGGASTDAASVAACAADRHGCGAPVHDPGGVSAGRALA